MGLFSSLKKEIGRAGEKLLDPFDIIDTGGIKRGIEDITGKTGERAAEAAAQEQEDIQQRIFDLLSPNIEAQQQQLQAGVRQLPALEAGATAEGFGANIGSILQGGALDPLIAERQRASRAALARSGLRRSGAAATEAARVPTDLAFQIESELTRRRQSLANQGLSGVGSGVAGATGALGGIGEARAGGILGGAQARSAGIGNILGLVQGGAQLLGAFSDESLKTSIIKIGELKGVNVYSWTWNSKANDIGLSGESSGFIANEILESHPRHVFEEDNLLTIDYHGLLQELKEDGDIIH